MKHQKLTQAQITKLAQKLMAKMQINGFSNDGFDVLQTGHVNGKEVTICWEVQNGIHQLTKVITQQGWTVFTVA